MVGNLLDRPRTVAQFKDSPVLFLGVLKVPFVRGHLKDFPLCWRLLFRTFSTDNPVIIAPLQDIDHPLDILRKFSAISM